MEFKIVVADKEDIKQVVKLSENFAEENCCNGIVKDDFKHFENFDVFVIKEANDVVGYGYGSFEIKNKTNSMYSKGQKSFYIEEIYILPDYRDLGLGKKLFAALEDYAKQNNCDIIETTAVSKDYKKLLDFYITKNNMQFWSASLIKKIK